MMEEDPQTVADVAWKAMREGRDVRAITAMLDRTYGDETGHVQEPHTSTNSPSCRGSSAVR